MLTHSLLHLLASVNSPPHSVQGAYTDGLCWCCSHLLLEGGVGSMSCWCLELAAMGHFHQVLSLGQETLFCVVVNVFVTKDNKYRSSLPYHRVQFKF